MILYDNNKISFYESITALSALELTVILREHNNVLDLWEIVRLMKEQ